MASYSKDELKSAVLGLIKDDEDVRQEIQKALKIKQRHWIVDIVSKTASNFFGTVAEHVVEMVADWLLQQGLHLLDRL